MLKPRIISVEVTENGEGLFHATSPQMRELFVSGETANDALSRVPEAIEGLYSLEGLEVCVVAADNENVPIPDPWIILDRNTQIARC